MDLRFTPAEEAFRDEVRAFLAAKLPARIARKVRAGKRLTKQDHEEWHAILHARGWLGNHWPVEHGGPNWTVAQRYIFDVEAALAHAPAVIAFGVSMLPVSSTAATGGARAFRSRARAPTSPASR